MAISLQQTPPGDTRWEARWGHYKHPHQRQAQRQEAHINFFGCSPRGRSDTSLIDPPTYSGQKFRQQTQKWRFYPWRHPVYYGFFQFTYKPINFSPYKKSAKVSPKKFSCKIQSPNKPPTVQFATDGGGYGGGLGGLVPGGCPQHPLPHPTTGAALGAPTGARTKRSAKSRDFWICGRAGGRHPTHIPGVVT
jgi:hypothetical protein